MVRLSLSSHHLVPFTSLRMATTREVKSSRGQILITLGMLFTVISLSLKRR